MDLDTPPSSQEPAVGDLLPAARPIMVGDWVTLQWSRPRRQYYGLCVAVWVNPSFRRRPNVSMYTVVFDDGDWADFDLPSLTRRACTVHPVAAVPHASTLAVRHTLHAAYLGEPPSRVPARHEDLRAKLLGWTEDQWAFVHGGPVVHPTPPSPPHHGSAPQPTQPAAHDPPVSRPTPAPRGITAAAAALLSLADTSSWWRRRTVPQQPPSQALVMRDNPTFAPHTLPPCPLSLRPGARPPPPSARSPRGSSPTLRLGAPSPHLLRILSSNAGGFASATAVMQAVSEWVHADADVVALQETWLTDLAAGGLTVPAFCAHVNHATDHLRARRYTILWANDPMPTAAGGAHNGVALLVRAAPDMAVGEHAPHPSGRLQILTLGWCGHRFALVNAYLPSSSPAARVQFINDVLAPSLARIPASTSRILCGDWNFVDTPELDRRPVVPATAAGDATASMAFHAACPGLVDLFRSIHPAAASFTFHRGYSCLARLDRFYSTADIQGYVAACSVVHSARGDHHPVCLTLRAAQAPERRGPGRRPLPAHQAADEISSAQLAGWATAAVDEALALNPEQLVAWWPHLTRRYADFAAHIDREQRQHRRQQEARLQVLQQNLEQAARAAHGAQPVEGDLTAHRAAYVLAHAELRAATAAAAPPAPPVLAQSRPGRVLSSLLNPPKPHTVIPALLLPDGTTAVTNSSIATALCRAYAQVSSSRVTDPQAQAAVLAALRGSLADGSVRPLAAGAAAQAGASEVTVSEVIRAMATTPAASSPGPSRIPYQLWRVGDDAWAPALAALFSAIGASGVTPRGFTQGTITSLPKPPAAASLPSSWRPITLLNTEYRILCKALAMRFGAILTRALGQEQTAFLPGRRIDDTLAFSDLLPHILLAEEESGATIYLDVAKAFDTIDRPFLYDIMREMGASEGMVAWAMILLHDTRASVSANGVESDLLQWHAGVRQGCPLSPLLYLFVAQALASWLRAQPLLGVTVAGVRYVSSHHADDTQVHMGDLSPAAMASLSAALDLFARATGQVINRIKSKAILIGQPLPQADRPLSIADIPVVMDVRSLGIPHSATQSASLPAPQPPSRNTRAALRPDPAVVAAAVRPASPFAQQAWEARLQGARLRLRAIVALPLSPMGRGLAASAYATSTLLYFSQFAGVLSQVQLQAVHALTLDAVSGGPWRRFPACVLISRPSEGGLGLLPLEEHTRARHAVSALQLMRALLPAIPPGPSPSPPAPCLHPPPATHPLLHLLPPAPALFAVDEPAEPLAGALPSRTVESPAAAPPCQHGHQPPSQATAPWMHLAATVLAACFPTLHPAHALLAFAYATPANAALGLLGLPRVRQVVRLPPGLLTHMAVAVQSIGPFTVRGAATQLPSDARNLVIPPPAHDPHSPCPLPPLLREACWALQSTRRTTPDPSVLFAVAAGPLRVTDLTDFLTRNRHAARDAVHRAYVKEALGHPSAPSARLAAATALRTTFASIWRHPCNDGLKEVLWRLAAGAVPGGRIRPWRCPCGFTSQHPRPAGAESPSQHAFWTCPVLAVLRDSLHAAASGLARHHVWLVQPPAQASLSADVWVVVCLAALSAMEAGRVALWTDGNGTPRSVANVRALAVQVDLNFWSTLSDYAAWAPPAAHADVPSDHPFLRRVAGRLVLAPH